MPRFAVVRQLAILARTDSRKQAKQLAAARPGLWVKDFAGRMDWHPRPRA